MIWRRHWATWKRPGKKVSSKAPFTIASWEKYKCTHKMMPWTSPNRPLSQTQITSTWRLAPKSINSQSSQYLKSIMKSHKPSNKKPAKSSKKWSHTFRTFWVPPTVYPHWLRSHLTTIPKNLKTSFAIELQLWNFKIGSRVHWIRVYQPLHNN